MQDTTVFLITFPPQHRSNSDIVPTTAQEVKYLGFRFLSISTEKH